MPVIRSKNLIANRSTGGCKKQGLAPSTGKSNAMRKQTMTKASANDKTIFCLNQVGGVGRFRSSTTYGDSRGCGYSISDAFNYVIQRVRASKSQFGAIIIKDKKKQYVSFYNNTFNADNINKYITSNGSNYDNNLNNGFDGYSYYNGDEETVVPNELVNISSVYNSDKPYNKINSLHFSLNKFTSLREISNLNSDRMYFFLSYLLNSIPNTHLADPHTEKYNNNFYTHANTIDYYLNCSFTWDKEYYTTYVDSVDIDDKTLTYNNIYTYELPTSTKSAGQAIGSVVSSLGINPALGIDQNSLSLYQYKFLLSYTKYIKLKSYEITIKSFNDVSI
jgi:hypothetical protein